jgi:hypothetical protein
MKIFLFLLFFFSFGCIAFAQTVKQVDICIYGGIEPSESNKKAGDQVIKAKMFMDCSYEGDLGEGGDHGC